MRGPTQNQRVLALLQTGPKSTHEILRAVPCIVHSRIAELRDRGHVIECERDGDLYIYTLLPSLGETDPPADDGGVPSRPTVAVPQNPQGASPTVESVSPNEDEEQLSLLQAPRRGAYSEAA